MKYFEIKHGEVLVIKGVRPSNQNDHRVQKKIAGRLERLIKENPHMELTELQQLFVKKISEDGVVALRDNNIDIAHNLAISMIMQAIADRANNPLPHAKYDELVENIITTEEADDKKFVKEFFQGLLDPHVSLQDKMKDADKVVDRLNCASKNLMPGHSSTNRSISKYRDPHYAKHKKGYVETPISVTLSKNFEKLFLKSYEPKSRDTVDGRREFQSSSICNTPKDSWYSPDIARKRY